MKKLYLVLGLSFLILGSAVAESANLPKGKGKGKHKTHKKAKKKKSKYMFNFQH